MPLSRLIGSRLRERRLALGLRQLDVAAAAQISPSFMNLIEHDRRRVSQPTLARLAEILATTPEVLGGSDETGLISDLRSAASGTMAEVARVNEFLMRFPGWAQALAASQRRALQAERAVGALNDRLAHDPYLSAALHDLLSALSSVRSTAAILAETPDIDPEWRKRFHQNLHADAERMSGGAEALVAYLDGSEGDRAAAIANPQEEVDAWLESQGWHLAGLETGDLAGVMAQAAGLASGAARDMAQAWVRVASGDVALAPLSVVQGAVDRFGPDPLLVAAALGVSPLVAMRRVATLPSSGLGLVICDGAGSLTFRKPAPGFAIPRFGAACALWPLFTALRHPMMAVEQRASLTGRSGEARYLLRAYCQPRPPASFGAPELCEAAMLIQPDQQLSGPDQRGLLAVGATCRICVRDDCPARREASILTGAS